MTLDDLELRVILQIWQATTAKRIRYTCQRQKRIYIVFRKKHPLTFSSISP